MSKKPLSEVLNLVSRLLEESGVEHILIGGFAIGLRGYPRTTVDIDFLVNGDHVTKARITLENNGFVCETETEEAMHFSGDGLVDFLIAKRPHSLNMLAKASKLEGVRPKVAQVEDIIGLKIQAYCNDPQRLWKDQADIAELIRTNPNLDWAQVMVYAKIFQQEKLLQEIRDRLQP